MSFASVSGERESLYHVPAGRGPEQRRYMEDLEAAGICVFCPDHFATYHREPIEIDFNNPAFLYNGRADVIDPKNAVLSKRVPVSGGELLLNAAAFAQSTGGLQGNTDFGQA